jgi:flagellar hook-associated protein 3 FlgL
MRVSTQLIFGVGAGSIGRQQAEWLRTQQQLSTGRRVLAPSDDPIASAQALRVEQSRALGAQYVANQGSARDGLALAESVLAGAGGTIQDARVLLVQAANSPLTDADRRSLAAELRGHFAQLLALANARDSNGEYLFAGYQGSTQPFVASAAGAAYNGDEGERLLQVASGRTVPVSASGAAIFDRVPTGNGDFSVTPGAGNAGDATHDGGSLADAALATGHRYRVQFTVAGAATTYDVTDLTTSTAVVTGAAYAPGQAIQFDGIQLGVQGSPADGDSFAIDPSAARSVFAALHDLAALLETPLGTGVVARAAYANGIVTGMLALEQASERVLEARARMGTHLKELDSLEALVSSGMLHDNERVSRLTDLDYAEAASRFAAQQTALEAAQQSYVRVTSLSLFDYL